MPFRRSRYQVQKVYLITCRDCNEDITRSVSGEEPETVAEADEYMREHEEAFHGG
jgi:hypothetical protein